MILNNKVFSFKRVPSAFLLSLGLACAALPAMAASVPYSTMRNSTQTSCDPEYMEAMNTRAYMEAQREIAQNQNLIFKPDSVLEYSCFGNFLSSVAKANLFSEQILGGDTLDKSLSSVVLSSVNDHLNKNFNHSPLGGRLPGWDPMNNSADQSTAIDGNFHVCKSMSGVWAEAHCMDFFADSESEAFHDFDWYASKDPRKFPGGMACNSKVLQGKADIAYNGRAANYVMPANAASETWPPNSTNYGSDADKVETYLKNTLPKGVAPATTCAAAIKTGIKVKSGSTEFDDAVCPNPGCTYDGSSCK